MTPPKKPWTFCNRVGCDTRIIFARHDNRSLPYEWDDRAPFTDFAVGSHVLIAGEAWTPRALIEDFQTRLGITEEKARELVSGYPWHRPHRCDPTPSDESTKDAA